MRCGHRFRFGSPSASPPPSPSSSVTGEFLARNGPFDVDGHDLGGGVGNIFIRTNDPLQSFARFKALAKPFLSYGRFGYRAADAEAYEVLWPKTLKRFTVE